MRQCIASPRGTSPSATRQYSVNQGSAPWARNRSAAACAAPGNGCRPDCQPHEGRRAARRGLRTPRRNLHPRRRADQPPHTPRSPHQARRLLATGRARPAPSIRPKPERPRTARTERSRAAMGAARAGTNARDQLSAYAARDCHFPDCALHHAAGSVRHHVGPPQHSYPTRWVRSWYERVCADWRAHAVFASIETEPSRFRRSGWMRTHRLVTPASGAISAMVALPFACIFTAPCGRHQQSLRFWDLLVHANDLFVPGGVPRGKRPHPQAGGRVRTGPRWQSGLNSTLLTLQVGATWEERHSSHLRADNPWSVCLGQWFTSDTAMTRMVTTASHGCNCGCLPASSDSDVSSSFRDLLLRAKHLFVAAKTVWAAVTARQV
jgi:hypothetical protein